MIAMTSAPGDGVLISRGFASELEVAAIRLALELAVEARKAGQDVPEVRVTAARTEVSCRALARLCSADLGERMTTVRYRVVGAIKEFFDVADESPELTLLSEMRTSDFHPLHADAEQRASGGWGPNHTHWRTHVGLLYLNTSGVDYQGGLLRLPDLGRTITPAAGMLVSFPTGHRHVHEVTPVTSGRRLSMAIWLTADVARAEPWMTRGRPCSVGVRAAIRPAGAGNARPPQPVGTERAAELLRLARSTLSGARSQLANGVSGGEPAHVSDGVSGGEPAAGSEHGPAVVRLTAHAKPGAFRSAFGAGATLEDAVRTASLRLAASRGPRASNGPVDARLAVWIRTKAEAIVGHEDIGLCVDLGLDGIELGASEPNARQSGAAHHPLEALTNGVERHDLLLDELTTTAGLVPGAWRDGATPLSRTEWDHYCEGATDSDAVRLRRLREAVLEPLTAATVAERVDLAADRLMAVQSADGYFLYSCHPFSDRDRPGPGNLVRQAGCGFAMARASGAARSPERRALLAASARRVIELLLARVAVRDKTVFIEDLPNGAAPARGLLGTLALTLAAVQSSGLTDFYVRERGLLVQAVLDSQRPDGSFRCLTDSRSAEEDGGKQDYFPGEALLALAVEAGHGSIAARRALSVALPFYRERFRARPTRAFALWQVSAWSRCAIQSLEGAGASGPDPRICSEFVFAIADWLLQSQIGLADGHTDLIGGFASPGRLPGCASAGHTEAVIRALRLAQRVGDGARTDRYRHAARLGLDFVRRLQITPATGFVFSDARRAIGATTTSLHDMTIRADHGQHTLTCLMAALETPGVLDE